jgi:hypothetical protein
MGGEAQQACCGFERCLSGESSRFAGRCIGTRGGPLRQGVLGADIAEEVVEHLRASPWMLFSSSVLF